MPKEESKLEFVNTTKSVAVWIDRITDYSTKPKPFCVKPGKSVFLTKSDYIRNKRQSEAIFTKGLLRRADATIKPLQEIDIRDDMSEKEMEVFVEKAEDIKVFGSKLRRLESINTLQNLLEWTKKKNKTYNFIEAVERRINKIQEIDEEI